MATIKGGARLEKKLKGMLDAVSKVDTLRVGFLENATYPNGTPVAFIAAIQNWGAPGAGIPPRPFFSNMVAKERDGWPAAVALNLKAADYDAAKALARVGEGIAGQLRQSIVDTNAPPLAPSTVKRKGHAKPLVDTGHMLGSVDYDLK